MERSYLVVSCANSDEILRDNLLLSPDIQSGALPCRPLFGQTSAASAYAAVVDERPADILIFVHQDIYFVEGWFDLLRQAVATLDNEAPDWAVIGSYGANAAGQHAGYLFDVCNNRVQGRPVERPTPVAILDEIVLVVRADSGVNFDPKLPGFHMYGTQIALAAAQKGKGVYVAHLPVVHNSRSIYTLDRQFGQAWAYLSRHWAHQLPVPNLMTRVMDGRRWPLIRWRIHNRIQLLRGKRRLYPRVKDVKKVAREFGYR
jgi:hypothetical protein